MYIQAKITAEQAKKVIESASNTPEFIYYIVALMGSIIIVLLLFQYSQFSKNKDKNDKRDDMILKNVNQIPLLTKTIEGLTIKLEKHQEETRDLENRVVALEEFRKNLEARNN